MAPAIIVAYNMFMNSVDQMDQRRARNPAHQKEQRLHMNFSTFILDVSALQVFALRQVVDDGFNVLDFMNIYALFLFEQFILKVKQHVEKQIFVIEP